MGVVEARVERGKAFGAEVYARVEEVLLRAVQHHARVDELPALDPGHHAQEGVLKQLAHEPPPALAPRVAAARGEPRGNRRRPSSPLASPRSLALPGATRRGRAPPP